MATVSSDTDLKVPAEKVWEMIGNFNALPKWHPAVEASELEDGGSVRRLRLVGGGEIVEQLERHDDSTFTYSYSIVNSPLPVANYKSTIRVMADGDGCKVKWSGDFDAAQGVEMPQAQDVIKNVYDTGLKNLQKMFGM